MSYCVGCVSVYENSYIPKFNTDVSLDLCLIPERNEV